MKPCFAFTCNDPYVLLLAPLLRSMNKVHGGRFPYRIYVFCNDTLSRENREKLKAIHDDIVFHDVDVSRYTDNGKMTIKYFSVECFALHNYGEERVIYTGADCLCISPVDELVKIDVDLGMPREKRRPEMFSNGVMTIGEKYLNDETYNALLKADYSHVKMFGNDMKLYNCFFKDQIKEIDWTYDVVNTEIEFLAAEGKTFDDIVFLHLINKPIEGGCREKLGPKIHDLWRSYFVMDYPEAKERWRKEKEAR